MCAGNVCLSVSIRSSRGLFFDKISTLANRGSTGFLYCNGEQTSKWLFWRLIFCQGDTLFFLDQTRKREDVVIFQGA